MESKKVLLFLTDGFEEIEALTTVDILRRGKVDVETISITSKKEVEGSHGIKVIADNMFQNIKDDLVDMIILPGGPGFSNYYKHNELIDYIKNSFNKNIHIAAICAAPTFLSSIGILDNKVAVCFPGMENLIKNSKIGNGIVEVSDNIITSKSAATAPYFALELLKILKGKEKMEEIYKEMHFELLS